MESPDRLLVENGSVIALGELAPGAVHEISNPLFAILGLVEFLLAEVEPGTRSYERLELIQQSAAEIRDIVQGLLAFASTPFGEDTATSLERVTRDTLALVRRLTLVSDIEISEEYGHDVPLVSGPESQVRRASLGLLLAALRAADSGGSICVRVSSVDGNPVLSVTGGEAKADGLGLELARSIARMHDGELVAGRGAGGSLELRLPSVKGSL